MLILGLRSGIVMHKSAEAQTKYIDYWNEGASSIHLLQLLQRWQISRDYWRFRPLQLSQESTGEVSLMIPQSSVRKSSQPTLALYNCRSAIPDCFDDLHYRELSRRRR